VPAFPVVAASAAYVGVVVVTGAVTRADVDSLLAAIEGVQVLNEHVR